jgi:SAM-dependent methyltransferase
VTGDVCRGSVLSVPLSDHAQRDIDALELYASAIDTSDYVAALAPLIRQAVPKVGRLLDVGAGGGQLGVAIHDPVRSWTAIEPSPTMRARLAKLAHPPHVIAAGWERAELASRHDTVLAATMPAFFDQPEVFLTRCRAWARTVVWVVPAHAGPKGLCFAGCLPREWHREDETPGIDIVMRGLASASRPAHIAFANWTFTGIVPDLNALSAYLADRLAWGASDERREALRAHLARQGRRQRSGYRLDIPRKSAVLVWGEQ